MPTHSYQSHGSGVGISSVAQGATCICTWRACRMVRRAMCDRPLLRAPCLLQTAERGSILLADRHSSVAYRFQRLCQSGFVER